MRALIVFLAIGMALAGCRTVISLYEPILVSTNEWNMLGRDARHSGFVKTSIEPPLRLEWTRDVSGGVTTGSPVYGDGVLMIPTLSGYISFVNIDSGEEFGFVNLRATTTAAPAVKDSLLVVPVYGGDVSLRVYNMKNASMYWEIQTGTVETAPLVVDRFLVTATTQGVVHCYDLFGKGEIWKTKLPARIYSNPASDGERAVVACSNGVIYGLDMSNGDILWKQPTGDAIFATLVMSDSLCIVPSLDENVYAFNNRTGKPAWKTFIGTKSYSGGALADSLFILGGTDETVYALNVKTGDITWSTRRRGVVSTLPVVAGSVAYVGFQSGFLVALDIHDGAMLWEHRVDGRIRMSPVIAGERIVVVSERGEMYCWRPGE